MSQEVFDKVISIAENYGMDITIGGGEPTLHPKCLDWVMQAALATIDVSMDLDGPAVLIVTNGKRTEIALKLAKLAHLGVIQAEVSQDDYHDPIDPSVFKEFLRYGTKGNSKSSARVRNVMGGIKGQGRAAENCLQDMEGCACTTLFIAPNRDFYHCGCKKTKLRNILTDEIPQIYWDNPDECECNIEEKELTSA